VYFLLTYLFTYSNDDDDETTDAGEEIVEAQTADDTQQNDGIRNLPPNLRIRGHLPVPIINGEEIAVENGRMSDFQGLGTLTLTLDRVILYAFMHHSSTSTYIPNFIEIKETFC